MDPHGGEAIQVLDVREELPATLSAPVPREDPHGGEAVHMLSLREGFQLQSTSGAPQTDPHRGEAVQMQFLWEELHHQFILRQAPKDASGARTVTAANALNRGIPTGVEQKHTVSRRLCCRTVPLQSGGGELNL